MLLAVGAALKAIKKNERENKMKTAYKPMYQVSDGFKAWHNHCLNQILYHIIKGNEEIKDLWIKERERIEIAVGFYDQE